MRTYSSIGVITVLVIVTMMMPSAQGHGSGSPTIGASGVILLTPAGSANDTFHGFLANFGLPIHAGDTVRFLWSANNRSGPAIYFEIHAHPQTEGFVLYYQNTSKSDFGIWNVPKTEPHMVLWLNSNPVFVNVTYALTLYPPPLSLGFIILISALSSAPLTLVAIGVIWWWRRRRRKHARPSPTPSDEVD